MNLGAAAAVVAQLALVGGVFVAMRMGLLGLARLGNRLGVGIQVPWISMGLATLTCAALVVALVGEA